MTQLRVRYALSDPSIGSCDWFAAISLLVTTKYSTQLSIRQLDSFNDDLEYQIKIKRTRARDVLHVFSHVEKIADPRSIFNTTPIL